MNTYSVVSPFPFDSECFSRVRSEKNKPPLGGVNDTGDQYDWATTIYWWALIRLFSRVANTALGGDVCSVFRGAALNPMVNVFWRPFAAADLSHGFRMERATVDFTAAKPLFPARQLFRERVKGNVWHLLLRVRACEWEEMLGYASLRTLEGLYKRCKHKPKAYDRFIVVLQLAILIALRDFFHGFFFYISCYCLCLCYHI